MSDTEASVTRSMLLTELRIVANKIAMRPQLEAIFAEWSRLTSENSFAGQMTQAQPVFTNVPATWTPDIWHNFNATDGGTIPEGLNPAALIWVTFRDGMTSDRPVKAGEFVWSEEGHNSITRFKIVPSPAKTQGFAGFLAASIRKAIRAQADPKDALMQIASELELREQMAQVGR